MSHVPRPHRPRRAGSLNPSSDLTQDALVRACLDHRQGAWEEFLERYGNLIYSTILKIGLPESDAEEAFQNSVVAIYRQLPRLRDHAKLLAWIIGISHRQAVNRIRSRSRESLLPEIDDTIISDSRAVWGDAAPDDEAPADLRARLQGAQQTRETLAALPERCRRLLTMLFLEDPPPDYQEIRRREGIPVGSIGPTRARCLDKARKIFLDRGWAG